MGLKEWLSLDFSKRADATDPPSPTPPLRKGSNTRAGPPQSYYPPPPSSTTSARPRRTSEARGSYYQTPRQQQPDRSAARPEPFAEYSVDRRSMRDADAESEYAPPPPARRSHRLSNASSSQYYYNQRQSVPATHKPSRGVRFQPHYDNDIRDVRAYQSESGYYFEADGVDDNDDEEEENQHANAYSHTRADARVPLPRSSQYESSRRVSRASVRHADGHGEPIIVKQLPRTSSLRLAPPPPDHAMSQLQQQPRGPPPPRGDAACASMRRMSSSGYHERRSSQVGHQPQQPPANDRPDDHHHHQQQQQQQQQRSSMFDAIRFSWFGRNRSSEATEDRLSQLASEMPRRSSLQRPVNEDAEIVMQGWLDKCGQQFKTWKWRFFVLRADGMLAYYADEHMKKFKGSINVGYGSKADISMQSNLIEKKNVFMIATGSRNMMISAPSQKMMTKWIAKLHAAGATPSEPWDPSKKTVNFFVRDTECPHEWKRYDDPTSYIHMEGCLVKRGHVNKNWKTRFFRIERGELRYYTEGQEQLKGSVDLKGTIVSPGMTQSPDGLKNYFVLTSKDGKFEMHLSAPNEQTMHRWIEALQEAQTVLGGKGTKGTVSGLALVVKRAEEVPLAKEEVIYEAPELINVELERRMESLIVVSCRAGTVPVGSQLFAVGGRSILRESYAAARHTLRVAMCPLKLHFLVPPYKKGELIKKSRSGFENWKRRVFMLTNGELQYFKEVASSRDGKTLKHRKTFALYGCYLNLIQMPGREFCIIVARSPTDKLVLETRNEEERIEWASVIYCSIRMVSQGVTPGHIENLQLEVARDPSAVSPSEIDGSFKEAAPLNY